MPPAWLGDYEKRVGYLVPRLLDFVTQPDRHEGFLNQRYLILDLVDVLFYQGLVPVSPLSAYGGDGPLGQGQYSWDKLGVFTHRDATPIGIAIWKLQRVMHHQVWDEILSLLLPPPGMLVDLSPTEWCLAIPRSFAVKPFYLWQVGWRSPVEALELLDILREIMSVGDYDHLCLVMHRRLCTLVPKHLAGIYHFGKKNSGEVALSRLCWIMTACYFSTIKTKLQLTRVTAPSSVIDQTIDGLNDLLIILCEGSFRCR